MRIANNLLALNSLNTLKLNNSANSKTIEKLSSGLRINKASDDAAGLSISEKMRAQIRGLSQASRNIQDGISLILVADGAMGEMQELNQRMRELCMQASNGTYIDKDRNDIQKEIEQLKNMIDEISKHSEFNNKKLFDGSITTTTSTTTIMKPVTITTTTTTVSNQNIVLSPNLNVEIGSDSHYTININGIDVELSFIKPISSTVEINASFEGNNLGSSTVVNSSTKTSQIVWKKNLGGSQVDMGSTIKSTSDGGYIIIGQTTSSNGDITDTPSYFDMLVMKTDSLGNVQWTQCIGSSSIDKARDIEETSDGGFIISGEFMRNNIDFTGVAIANDGIDDACIVKINSTGSIEWIGNLGGFENEYGSAVKQTADGGYLLLGSTHSSNGDFSVNHGGWDSFISKFDSSGLIEWKKVIGGSGDDNLWGLERTNDGGYIAIGSTSSNDGDISGNNGISDAWVIKLDSNGSTIWQKTIGGIYAETAAKINQTADGGFVITGSKSSSLSADSKDGWVCKLNSFGDVQWERTIGGTSLDTISQIVETDDGGFYVAGFTTSTNGEFSSNHGNGDILFARLSDGGNIEYMKTYGGTGYDATFGLCLNLDGSVLLAGNTGSVNYDITGQHGTVGWNNDNSILSETDEVDIWLTKLHTISNTTNNTQCNINLDDLVKDNKTIKFNSATITFADNSLATISGININADMYDSVTSTETIMVPEDIVTTTITGQDYKDFVIQSGSNTGNAINIRIDALGLNTLKYINGMPSAESIEKATESIKLIDDAINLISNCRSNTGACQNRLEKALNNVINTGENLSASESRIRDMDMASGVMEMVKTNILIQATQAILAQANKQPESILQLLK